MDSFAFCVNVSIFTTWSFRTLHNQGVFKDKGCKMLSTNLTPWHPKLEEAQNSRIGAITSSMMIILVASKSRIEQQ
jgi:hypothetical protein